MSRVEEVFPRISPKEWLILGLLIGGERYGLELVELSEGKLAKGTVYVTLNRMRLKGLVESRLEELPPDATGLPRRLYRPTGYGQRVTRAWELAGAQPAPSGVSG
jgi:DNA-binding PadR family transcriptional regulator